MLSQVFVNEVRFSCLITETIEKPALVEKNTVDLEGLNVNPNHILLAMQTQKLSAFSQLILSPRQNADCHNNCSVLVCSVSSRSHL